MLVPVNKGVDFVGFRCNGHSIQLNKAVIKRFTSTMKSMRDDYSKGMLSLPDIHPRIQAWLHHASYGSTYHLRKRLLDDMVFQRS